MKVYLFDTEFSKKKYSKYWLGLMSPLGVLVELLVFFYVPILPRISIYKAGLYLWRVLGIKKDMLYWHTLHLSVYFEKPQGFYPQNVYQNIANILGERSQKEDLQALRNLSFFCFLVANPLLYRFARKQYTYAYMLECFNIDTDDKKPGGLLHSCRLDAIPYKPLLTFFEKQGCSQSRLFLAWLILTNWHTLPLETFSPVTCPKPWLYAHACFWAEMWNPGEEIFFDSYDSYDKPKYDSTVTLEGFYTELLQASTHIRSLFAYAKKPIIEENVLSEAVQQVYLSYKRLFPMSKAIEKELNTLKKSA